MTMIRAFVLVLFVQAAMAQDAPPPDHPTRERMFHVLQYKLNLSIDVHGKTLSGNAVITLVPLRPDLDTVLLDAAGLVVSRVKMKEAFLSSDVTGETLAIALGKPYGLRDTLVLDIGYSASSPQKGMYFIQPDSGYPGKQWQVWTQGEAVENHFWFPCYDAPNDLSTSEMIVTVDDSFMAVSNGKLIRETRDAKAHKRTFHWLESKPHVSYLISLAIGDYVVVSDSAGSVPIQNYVYPHQAMDAPRSFGKTPAMIDYFSSVTGYPYPWEKYGHAVVQDFIYSGEENVSVSTLTDRTIHDARADLDNSSAPLVAHELAHQWFGDLVSFRDWSHAWLSEGFATFFEMLFREHDQGKEAAAKERYDAQQLVVNTDRLSNRRPTVCRTYVAPMDLFDSHIYQKGALVLQMLRDILGDELFFTSIRAYTRKFAFRNTETHDFKVAIEEATGYNLEWFFEEWLYRAGYPEFQVDARWDQGKRMEVVVVTQTQKVDSLTPVFRMPVDIEVWVHNQPETYRVMIEHAVETFEFPAYQTPQLVLFDKGSRLLKKVAFQKSMDELLYQARFAADGVDRMEAINELQWMVDSADVRRVLERVLMEDNVNYVRRDAAWALGDVRRSDESAQLISAYGDRDPGVRAASVTSLGRYRGPKVVSTLQHAFRKDSSYVVAAAALRALTIADSTRRNEYIGEALQMNSYNEVIRSTALQRLADIGDAEAQKTLIAYTKYGIDRNLRIQAIRSLAVLWKNDEKDIMYLTQFLYDPSYYVRRTTLEALGNLDREGMLREFDAYLSKEHDVRLLKVARDARAKVEKTLESKQPH